MAYFTETITTEPRTSIIATFFGKLAGVFDRITDAQARSDDMQRMQGLSDAELAKLGVRREEIVRYVYRDIYYI